MLQAKTQIWGLKKDFKKQATQNCMEISEAYLDAVAVFSANTIGEAVLRKQVQFCAVDTDTFQLDSPVLVPPLRCCVVSHSAPVHVSDVSDEHLVMLNAWVLGLLA
uniref:40S ribosomal protein S12 n=1 Tax=Syphacia muris TaxID=451379 RepID=A0A0N5AV75_9BILA